MTSASRIAAARRQDHPARLGALEEPARAGPRGRCVIGEAQRCGLVVAPDVLGHSCRYPGDARLLPRRALGDPDEGLDRLVDVVGVDDPPGAHAVAVTVDGPVVCGAQPPGLVDCGMRVGIAAWGQRARQHRVAVVGRWLRRSGRRGVRRRRAARVRLAGPDAGRPHRRDAERAAEREIAEQPARGSGALDLTPHRTECDRGESFGFEDVGERTHGTRAERSDRGEQHHVDALLAQPTPTGRSAVETHPAQVELVAGIGQVPVGDGADDTLGGELVEAVEWEHDVHVVAEADRVEVGAPVTGDVVPPGPVEDAVAGVDAGEVVLVGMVQRRRGDQGHGRLGQGRRSRERGALEHRCLDVLGERLQVTVGHGGIPSSWTIEP